MVLVVCEVRPDCKEVKVFRSHLASGLDLVIYLTSPGFLGAEVTERDPILDIRGVCSFSEMNTLF